jgi:hypothetical protein
MKHEVAAVTYRKKSLTNVSRPVMGILDGLFDLSNAIKLKSIFS